MIWYLPFAILLGLLAGFFEISIWIVYGILFVVIVFIFFQNPLLFGKDTQKIMNHLKKSKAPNMQFLYYLLLGDLVAAEQKLGKIRSKNSRQYSEITLLIERKQYENAKELLNQMGNHKAKWYALADIAINEGDTEAFKQYRAKITDTFYLHMLEVDQFVFDGKKEEAIKLLENMIPKLRGYKLLTAVHYKQQILEGKV